MSGYIWTEDGRLTVDRFGCAFGDDQAGKEYSRRFWRQHDDGTFTVITDTYGVERRERGEYIVSNQTELLRCTDKDDPGGTELHSDYENDYGVNYRSITTLREAEREARRMARTYGPEAWEHYPGEIQRAEAHA